jgi:hypothetical protein
LNTYLAISLSIIATSFNAVSIALWIKYHLDNDTLFPESLKEVVKDESDVKEWKVYYTEKTK